MKKIVCLVLTLCLLACFGCSNAESPAETTAATSASAAETQGPTVITDHAGREVTLPEQINRIVVCDVLPLPSVLTVFFNSAQKLVGISPSSMAAAQNGLLSELYPDILNAETGFINGSEVNMEELMKLKPDLVFYLTSNAQLGEKLDQAGICSVAVATGKWNYDCIETLNQWVSLLSQIFPDNNKTEICKLYSRNVLDMVQARLATVPEDQQRRALFLFQYNDSTIVTSGAQFFGQWWADAIHVTNVAQQLEGNSVAVNMEQIYEWDPDLIFVTNFNAAQPEDILNSTVGTYDWSGIRAVKDGEVYKMPLGMYRSAIPGADTPVALIWMVQTAYPELFRDINVVQDTIDYYKAVFDITLTAQQAEEIFAPSSAAGKIGR